jgi:hypothetical protein
MTDELYAAIIGVDRYPAFDPDAQLSGCVNDALAIREFFLTRVSVPRENIRLHLSPESPGATAGLAPEEVLSAEGRRIRATFDELRRLAKPGAHVALYYAGHGVRIDRRGSNERVYGFMPSDATFDAAGFANLILDRELNAWLRALTEGGATVSVLADTCHAGGSTRSAPRRAAKVRRVTAPALSEEAWRALVASHPALTAPARPRAASRGAAAGNGWFDGSDEERAWVVLTACLDRETAKEDELDGAPHGLFTACLLRELRKVPAEATASLRWMDFFPALRRAVVTRAPELQCGEQTPVLEGRPERAVFGGAWRPFEPGFAVQQGSAAGEVRLDGGVLDGLDEGAEIGIYPPETTSFRAADEAGVEVVRAQIVSATPAKSLARLLRGAPAAIPDGSRARLLKPAPRQPRLGVRLTDVPGEIVSALAKSPGIADFVALDPTPGRIDVEVRPWKRSIPDWAAWEDAPKPAWVGTPGGWVLVPFTPEDAEPTEDDVIAYVPRPDAPGVDDGAAGLAASLGRALVRWARYARVLRLCHVNEDLAAFIEVRLCMGEEGADAFAPLSPGPSGEYAVEEGEPIWVELRATKKPPSRVFVAFLACSNDGNTMLQWPAQGGAPTLGEKGRDESLAAGQTIRVGEDRFKPARPTVRSDQSSSLYTFKVIACVVPPGEAPPALQGLILPQTAQEELALGTRRASRGSMSRPAALDPAAWCTWDLPVRVRRK